MAQLAPGASSPGAQCAGEADALASLSQRRQRACGTKELDVAAASAGLPTAGEKRNGATHQPALQRNLGTVAQFFPALGQAGGEAPGRQQVGAAARPSADGVSETHEERAIGEQ